MPQYITPQFVHLDKFIEATTVKSRKLFGPKLKPRGERLLAIDTALEQLRTQYPVGNAGEARAYLLLVIRETRNWLRKMRVKAESGKTGTDDRGYKAIEINNLLREATEALIASTPGLARALDAYAQQKGGFTGRLRMKGLDGTYVHEGGLYRKGGKTQGHTFSGTYMHTFENETGQSLEGIRNKSKELGQGKDVRRLIESMFQGEVLFDNFTEQQFEMFGRWIEAKGLPSKVLYLSKMERLQHMKYVRNGALANIDDTPFVTKKVALTAWAMDRYGNFFAMHAHDSPGVVTVNHSSLLGGKDVACAGCIVTNESGRLVEIDNNSGHYKPTRQHLHGALAYLAEQGLDLEGVTVALVIPGSPQKETWTARQFLANPTGLRLGGQRGH